MLLYLSSHSRLNIAFAVHQYAHYTFAPTALHERALKCIGYYFKGTLSEGLIMTPSDDLCIHCYPNVDYTGLYSYEVSQDPYCAHSCMGYVINIFGCTVLW